MNNPTADVAPAATGHPPTIADVLNAAADLVAALPHARAGRLEVHAALRDAAPTYTQGQDALDALINHLQTTGGDDGWLVRWAGLRRREEIADLLRAAAQAEAGQAVTA